MLKYKQQRYWITFHRPKLGDIPSSLGNCFKKGPSFKNGSSETGSGKDIAKVYPEQLFIHRIIPPMIA